MGGRQLLSIPTGSSYELEWLDSYHGSLSCKIHAHLDSNAQGPEDSFAECFRGSCLGSLHGLCPMQSLLYARFLRLVVRRNVRLRRMLPRKPYPAALASHLVLGCRSRDNRFQMNKSIVIVRIKICLYIKFDPPALLRWPERRHRHSRGRLKQFCSECLLQHAC